MIARPPSEDELHAYADGRLAPERGREIEAYLSSRPDVAARIREWRRDGEHLRATLSPAVAWPADPRLDPGAIRRTLRARFRRRLQACAAIVISLGVGVLGGWQMHAANDDAKRPPMQDAVEAYRIFATDRNRPVEMAAGDAGQLQGWLSARLGRPLPLPDLGTYGYRLLGGRMLSTPDGAAAWLLYENPQGLRLSYYIRPSTRFPDGLTGSRQEGGLVAKYWFRNGYGFAVVGRADDPHTREIQEAAPTST